MSQLPEKLEAIIAENTIGCAEHVCDRVRNAVSSAYALSQKPQRELTRDEKYAIWLSVWTGKFDTALCNNGSEVVDKIIAAYIAKQQEPETVTFRAARNRNDHSEIYMAKADSDWSGSNWEWLPGEPQTIEVKLP